MEDLTEYPAECWVADQSVVLDWYDGPRAGLCRLRTPRIEFVFDLLAERATPDGLDDRLFSIGIVPNGTVTRLTEELTFAGAPTSPVWVPMWQGTPEQLRDANRAVVEAKSSAKEPRFVVSSSDMTSFRGLIKVDEFSEILDWNIFLKPSQ